MSLNSIELNKIQLQTYYNCLKILQILQNRLQYEQLQTTMKLKFNEVHVIQQNPVKASAVQKGMLKELPFCASKAYRQHRQKV